jgi:hypothetical protein
MVQDDRKGRQNAILVCLRIRAGQAIITARLHGVHTASFPFEGRKVYGSCLLGKDE